MNEAIKVLHLVTRITQGGSEKRILDALQVTGDHLVVTGNAIAGKNLSEIESLCKVELLPSLRREPSLIDDIKAVLNIRKTLLQSDYSILHTHQSKAGVLARIAVATLKRDARPKVIHSLSMASFGKGYGKLSSSLFKFLEKATKKWVDRYAVVGDDLAATFREIGVPAEKLVCIRSSLELEEFKKTAFVRKFVTKQPVKILFVGSLDERKGIHFMPDIMEQLSAEGVSAELKVAGEGHLDEWLVNESKARELPIEILGFRRNIAALMGDSDLLILPSSAEGLPQVLVQACVNKLPFVAFDVHGAAELIAAGANGQSCSNRTAAGITSGILTLIEDHDAMDVTNLDSSQWQRAQVIQIIEETYRSMLAEKR